MKNEDDIKIGENSWIEWIEIGNKKTIDIDKFLEPTLEFWDRLEINCFADCCGFNAFSFLRNDIKNASSKLNQTHIIDELSVLKTHIINIEMNELESDRINSCFHKNVFLKLIDHISEQINT